MPSQPPQPPHQSSMAETADFHPLRQHSISQDDSPTIPVKQPIGPDPTSYAARAQGKPSLLVDTSPPERHRSYHNSEEPQYEHTSGTARHRVRKDSVPDRSPLQNLEVTFGDMTKEEKRARVEEAERDLRVRREGNIDHGRSIPRKPVGSMNGSSLSNGRSHTSSSRRQTDAGPQSSSRSKRQRQSSLNLESFPSRDRRYGYDASRTGGAAAAAVGAYQSARHQPLSQTEHLGQDPYGPPRYHDDNHNHNQRVNQHVTPQPAVRSADVNRSKSTGNRNPSAVPKAQKVLGSERVGAQASAPITQHAQEPDPIPPSQVRRNEAGPPYEVPPQTAAGQEAREAVGLDSEQFAHETYGGRGGRLKFSQVVHPFTDGTGRRYKDVEYLDDWKHASTGTLTAAEIDLDPTGDQQAWWERERNSSRTSRGRAGAPTSFVTGSNEDGTGRTAFNPPLSLKCGPLLRYTGMRKDNLPGAVEGGKQFWRGSVMIVTEDATSSTEAAPILRLFAQPKDLYQPPLSGRDQVNGEARHVVEDPVAGQTKCGSRGQTLYVKHVSQLTPETDLSMEDGENGLFTSQAGSKSSTAMSVQLDGEQLGRTKEVRGHKLHHERGLTFWRFNIEVELRDQASRIAYRVNGGPTSAFWVPAKDEPMSIMFHSCNGFSLSVDPNKFSGPDPLWRDVLNTHQQKPFHVMIGGGDQIYNDAAMRDTHHFQEWLKIRNLEHKYGAPFSEVLQDELETFYLHRYAMWFSQGLFGMANAQIPMINIWDDHDIIDGYGSYPHHFMSCPVFTGLGAVAFKYYMLFQHQSLPPEDHTTEPSWVLGISRGPYINQRSRSVYMSLGHEMAFLGVDCRTERMRDEVLSHETYNVIMDRLDREVQKGEVKHLIVLLGIPIAYPRMTFAENILTSRAMDPIKALARSGVMGGVVNKFDGGIEVLDDLDDHWTAKHHKEERHWLIEDLQDFAAEKSVRITILGGDVHLAAVGQFYSKKKLAVPKDHDHRYIPNIISSAIVNTPPPEAMADFLNKRNKVHHFDDMTDEDMIPLFTGDVDGQARNNHHLLPRRNYCTIRPYGGEMDESPPASISNFEDSPPRRRRSFSLTRRNSSTSQDGSRKPSLLRRLSNRVAPPSSYRGPADVPSGSQNPYYSQGIDPRVDGNQSAHTSTPTSAHGSSTAVASEPGSRLQRSNSYLRRPNIGADPKAWAKDPSGRQGHIDLTSGLEVVIRCEVNQKDPSGRTQHYRLLVPALDYQREAAYHRRQPKRSSMAGLLGSIRRRKDQQNNVQEMPYETNEPATPAMAGDQRYTTMMEDREKAALGATTARNTDRTTAAQVLNGEEARLSPPMSPTNLRERATLDSLPRSGVVETDMPAEVPRQPYHEQRRGSLDQHRAHASVGRSRSLSDRSNSFKRTRPEQNPESSEDRAMWGAKQVRGELQSSQSTRTREQEKGLRRYYASPFDSTKRQGYDDSQSPPLPSKGLAPPLGAVNNRVDLMPSQAPGRSVSGSSHQRKATNADARRVVSDPARNKKQANQTTAAAAMPSRSNHRSVEKDPYAHYMPEAVEAEFQSDEDVSDLDDGYRHHNNHNHDGISEVSSLGDNEHMSRHGEPRDDSFASTHTNTNAAQNGAYRGSPLYSDEDDLDADDISPDIPAQSPERKRHGELQSRSRPQSKIDRLTGATASGQRASYASGQTMSEDEEMGARPVGQGASGKAAKMLGADPHEDMNEGNVMAAGNGTKSGRLGGLMRRLSEQGEKTRKRLSANGGVR
ncbi:MAG: hypothetical protein Q9162_003556 [Coniocarpon cinnabarinum]